MDSLNDPELVRKAYADEKRYAARMAKQESPRPLERARPTGQSRVTYLSWRAATVDAGSAPVPSTSSSVTDENVDSSTRRAR